MIHGTESDVKEIIDVTKQVWAYVPKDRIDVSWRGCSFKNIKNAVLTNGKLDLKKLKHEIAKQTEVKVELFDKHAGFSGSLESWSASLNQPLHNLFYGKSSNADNNFDVTTGAQLLRYTGGAGISGDYYPLQGLFSFSAEMHGELDLYNATLKVCDTYIPNAQGWELKFGKDTDLGAVRVEYSSYFRSYAGASVLASINLDFQITKAGKLLTKGTNIRKLKTGTQLTMGANIFAGIEFGNENGISIWWRNPEVSSEWDEFASLDFGGDVAAGIGFDAEFEIKLSEGKFVIFAKAALVEGLGASGDVAFVVYTTLIKSFIAFVYHKIMNQNYKYVGFMTDEAIKALTNLMTKFIFSEAKDIEKVFDEGFGEITNWWYGISKLFEPGKKLEVAIKLADSINTNHTKLTLTRPEVKGRLLFMLTDPDLMVALGFKTFGSSIWAAAMSHTFV